MNEKICDGNMDENNKSDGSLLGIILLASILLGGIVFLIIQVVHFLISIWHFFTEPNLLPRIIEYIKAFGLCCGGVILFIVVITFLMNILTPKYYDDSDDYHASR